MATKYHTKKTYGEKLLDPRWQKKRLEVFERDGFTCQRCGDTENTLHVHHFCYPKNKEPWEVEDHVLTTLCADCHKVEHIDRNSFTELERELIEYIDLLTGISIRPKTDDEKQIYQAMNKTILKFKTNG